MTVHIKTSTDMTRYTDGVDGQHMLTVKEAAERLRTTETTIRRWIRAGKLRGRMPGGTKLGYLIVESDVLRLLPGSQGRAGNA